MTAPSFAAAVNISLAVAAACMGAWNLSVGNAGMASWLAGAAVLNTLCAWRAW